METLKIVITGQKGFIGKILRSYLVNKGYEVLDIEEDISTIQNCHVKVDCVVHLASKTSEKDFSNNPVAAYETNIIGTLNVLEFCKKNKAKLIFSSSCGIYADNSGNVKEGGEIAPQSSYSTSKYIGEQLCYRYWHDFHVPIVVLRLFNVYGIGQKWEFIIPYIHHCIINNHVLTLNTPDSKRDFIYAYDVCFAISKAISFDNKNYNVFNVGSGKTISIIDLARKIYELWEVPFKVNISNKEKRKDLPIYADYGLIRTQLDWEPKVSIDKGLRLLKEYYKSR